MFGKKQTSSRKSSNPLVVLFRLILSLGMFVILLVATYSAYKHFSGLDPLKLDPKSALENVVGIRTPDQFVAFVANLKSKSPPTFGQALEKADIPLENLTQGAPDSNARVLFKFMVFADSHNDTTHLQKALSLLKKNYPESAFIIGLGDYTDVGTTEELRDTKKVLDLYGLRYFLVPGDHDLWDARDKQKDPVVNFKSVFGLTYQSFVYQNFRLILLNNSDIYEGVSGEQIDWLEEELTKARQAGEQALVFLHIPLFHPSSDHVMGRVEKELVQQAKTITYVLKQGGVKKVFAGDAHYFSQYNEPVTDLPMVTVGAVTLERNPQVPRFAIVSVLEDNTILVEDVEIN